MIIEDLIENLRRVVKEEDSDPARVRLEQLRKIVSDRRENNDSLRNYIADMKIDDIEDDQEFMEAEHDAVFDYCHDKRFLMSRDDMKVIRARGLLNEFYEWSE